MSDYDPRDHYWIVGGDEARAWASARAAYVAADDKIFAAWRAAGRLPTRIGAEVELWDVLRTQAPQGLPFDAIAYLAALRWERERGGAAWNGWAIPTDDRSQLKYAAEALAVATGSRQDGSPWKFAHGFEALSNDQALELARAARRHVLACFAAEARVTAALAAGTVEKSAAAIEEAFVDALPASMG